MDIIANWSWPQWVAAALLFIKAVPLIVRLLRGGYLKVDEPAIHRDLAAVCVWSLILSTGGFWA